MCSMCMCMHVCTRMYVMCVCVRVYVRVSSWVGLHVATFSDLFGEIRTRCRRSGSNSDWFVVEPIRWRFETDSLDDLKICTGSCSEDQTTIQFKNHVVSCECYSIGLFLIQAFYLIILCEYVSDFCIILLMPNYYYTVMPWCCFIVMSFTLL